MKFPLEWNSLSPAQAGFRLFNLLGMVSIYDQWLFSANGCSINYKPKNHVYKTGPWLCSQGHGSKYNFLNLNMCLASHLQKATIQNIISVISHNGKEYEKYIYIYIYITESLCWNSIWSINFQKMRKAQSWGRQSSHLKWNPLGPGVPTSHPVWAGPG